MTTQPASRARTKRRRTQRITPHVLALASRLLRSGRANTIGDAAARLHVAPGALRKCIHADGRIRPKPGRRERILRIADKVGEAVRLMEQQVPLDEICRSMNLTERVLRRQLRILERKRRLARRNGEAPESATAP